MRANGTNATREATVGGAAIEFEEVTKRYDDGHVAVADLSLSIGPGEFVILVGPSGCGKSTTLRMVAGLEEMTSGQVRIAGEVVNDRAPKDRDVAMVFQTYALYPHMTVRQNMGFSLRLARVKRDEIERRVLDAARILDLEEHLERQPSNLSGGQRQRVAMGRAIVRDPSAFLMDEPLSNLDAKLRVQMRAEIARLQERLGTTTIYVTHDQVEAMTLGDRVGVMSKGILQQVDSPDALYGNPANLFVAGFMGSPTMNFFEGELVNGVVRTPIGDLPVTDERRRRLEGASPHGREVIVGIRPEHFEDARLVGTQEPRFVFDAPLEVTESVGSDVYAHFTYGGWTAGSPDLDGLAPESRDEEPQLGSGRRATARLSGSSEVRAHETISLWVDLDQLHIFDRADGRCLTRAPEGDAAPRPAGNGALKV